jgi:hypothetical protein
MIKLPSFHDIFSVKSLTFVRFRSIAMYYWYFVISYRDKQNFSVCYCTVSPLCNIGKYFAIIKRKVIFPISQILTKLSKNLIFSHINNKYPSIVNVKHLRPMPTFRNDDNPYAVKFLYCKFVNGRYIFFKF